MIQPTKPWPKPSPYDDMLSELVASGDIARVRDYFDSVFWEGRKERPDWTHMRIALLREDRPMLKLLHTWGAKPNDAELAAFRAAARDKYPDYLKLLRSSGFRPENAVWEELTDDPLKPSRRDIEKRAFEIYKASGSIAGRDTENWLQAEKELTAKMQAAMKKAAEANEALMQDVSYERKAAETMNKIPADWIRLVKTFQAGGANEAVIAGGALRDLYNERPIKDVDIFLRTRGSEKKNRKFLKEIFSASGITVVGQQVGYGGYGGSVMEDFPDPQTRRDQHSGDASLAQITRETELQSWKVMSADKTEYNIIFVDDKLERKAAEQARSFEQRSVFAGAVIDSFDIGLCQIACDGDSIVSTPAYRDDVKHKRVSLIRPNMTSEDHLQRVVAKYKDWQLNPAAKQALQPRPKPKPPRRSYSYY